MYLGAVLLDVGLALILTPISLSRFIILGSSAMCFFIASRIEDSFNIEKFGEDYKKNMSKVPALNFLKGFKNKNQL